MENKPRRGCVCGGWGPMCGAAQSSVMPRRETAMIEGFKWKTRRIEKNKALLTASRLWLIADCTRSEFLPDLNRRKFGVGMGDRPLVRCYIRVIGNDD